MYFDTGVLLTESALEMKRTVHDFVYGLNSLCNQFSPHYFPDRLQGMQRWRTVRELHFFSSASPSDLTITIAILTFCSGPCKCLPTVALDIVYWLNLEPKLDGILKTVAECGGPLREAIVCGRRSSRLHTKCVRTRTETDAIFTRVSKIAESDSCSSCLCPSVCPHGIARLQVDGFWWKLIFETFF